jgi:MFS family permease
MTATILSFMSLRFFFTLAVQMQAVILGWRIYEILNSPLSLGMIGLAEAIPAIGLALFSGYLVDRSRPLVVFKAVALISLFSALLVVIEISQQGQFSVFQQASLLYLSAFLTGLARSFVGPCYYSIVPHLFDKSQAVKFNALLMSVNQIARVVGPAIGGLAYGYWGSINAALLVCASLLISLFCFVGIRIKIGPQGKKDHSSLNEELFAGLNYVFKHKLLLPALSLDMISVFFGGVTALLPLFAKDILHVGAEGLGWLRAAPAIGAAVMMFYVTRRSDQFKTGKHLLLAVAGFGFCIIIFGLSQSFWISMLALVFSGVFDSISMILRSAIVQLSSPEGMRGKIAAVNSIFIGSSNELGALESGIAAQLLGPIAATHFGGAICLLTVAFVSYKCVELRRLDISKI